jgi:hypothetical protein
MVRAPVDTPYSMTNNFLVFDAAFVIQRRQQNSSLMKTRTTAFLALMLCSTLATVHAQMGGMGGAQRGGGQGPQISAAMAKLFGDHSAFSASMESQVKMSTSGDPMSIPGKMAYDAGKFRFEMNLTEMKGSQLPPQAAAQMKAMGMDNMVTISRPDRKMSYIIYPGLTAYAEMPIKDPDADSSSTDFKIETTELGKETVEGQECVKNKVIVTGPKGDKHESTVWNSVSNKKFPAKIETMEQGMATTMIFKDVKLSRPDSSLFEPPSDYKKYNSIMELTQQEIMKKMGGGQGMPPRGQ